MSQIGTRATRLATGRAAELIGLAVLAYVPFLRSSPHQVSADTKQLLYLDPGGLLTRAPLLWDGHVAAGTVPHQQIGYLFPMGPYYWVTAQLGVPDWIAQRLWLGSISFVAVLGARYLFMRLGAGRLGALAGALVYMLTPYQLAFTARMSVLLLPWAALPWLVICTMRAVREGGWRFPALIALIVVTVGSVNASSLLLALVAPIVWLVLEAARGRDATRRVVATAGRIGLLSIGVSAWWAVGLRLQGAYGLPVLQLTENVKTVAAESSPNDVLRGIGNWFFYGKDLLGYSIDQTADYAHDHFVVVCSVAVPAAGLLAGLLIRWRHRAYFATLILVGTIIAVGSWPYEHPSPYGRMWRQIADNWSPALALRNTPRVVPIIVLGVAGMLAATVRALAAYRLQVAAALAVAVMAFVAFLPVWRTGYLSTGVNRPESIPQYWKDAAAAMQKRGDATRVLEIPGSPFATYRWGNAVEPVTPALMDRPYVAREVLPYGTPPSVNLLDAFDRRLQKGTFEPQTLAAFARRFGAGTVSLRSDLAYERTGTPRPRLLWAQLTAPLAPGLRAPESFGPANPNVPSVPLLDPLTLRTAVGASDPPPVALFQVEDPVAIVHTAPEARPVVLAGDGDGIVDADGAGLLDGRQLVLELAATDDATLRHALEAGADIVLTDSNRRSFRNFFSSIGDTTGPTERAGQKTTDPNGYEFRLETFPGSTDADRSVADQIGGTVDATSDGGAARPEDRAVYAFDGDVRTSWRVGGAHPQGNHLTVVADHRVTTDRVTFVQPRDGPRDRVLTKVRLRFDQGAPLDVDLGPESLTADGQTVTFPTRTAKMLDIELRQTSKPQFSPATANAVGFAEVRLGDLHVSESIRLPVDVADRIGEDAAGHALDVVLARQHGEPSDPNRQDQELALRRTIVLPDTRDFALTGTARINPNAPDRMIDDVLGTVASGATFTASSHLRGDLRARASRAFDGDPSTAWQSSFGSPVGQWLAVGLAHATTVDHVDLTIVADARHSVPTRVQLVADGRPGPMLTVPPIDDRGPGAIRTVTLPFPHVTASHLQLVVRAARPPASAAAAAASAPLAIAEARFAGVRVAASPTHVPSVCRDLVSIDDVPQPVRIAGRVADARNGLDVVPCRKPASGSTARGVELANGSHRLVAREGLDTSIDVDRLVLSSGADGEPATVGPRGAPLSSARAVVEHASVHPTSATVTLRTDGKPFWFVFGESFSDGWKASIDNGSLGGRQLVDGYANGWSVRPGRSGTVTIRLDWKPQRQVWAGFGVAAIAIAACGVILLRRRQRATPGADSLRAEPTWVSPFTRSGRVPSAPRIAVLALGIGGATCMVTRPLYGVAASAIVVLASVWPPVRPAVVVAVPALLALSWGVDQPDLAWLALALFAGDLVVSWARATTGSTTTARESPEVTTVPRS
jgi:arabinofuranan 3-O-arabinosyltransferase